MSNADLAKQLVQIEREIKNKGNIDALSTKLDELSKMPQIIKFPPFLTKIYRLIAKISLKQPNPDYVCYIKTYFMCLTSRYIRYVDLSHVHKFIDKLKVIPELSIEIPLQNSSGIIIMGGFKTKRIPLCNSIDLSIQIKSYIPAVIVIDDISVAVQHLKSTNNQKVQQTCKITDYAELKPNEILSYNTQIDVYEDICRVDILNATLKVGNINLTFPISRSMFSKNIIFEPSLDGITVQANIPDIAIANIDYPIEINIYSLHEDAIFFYMSNFGANGHISLKKSESTKSIIFIKKEIEKFRARIDWLVTKNNLSAVIESSAQRIDFVEPFEYNTKIFEWQNPDIFKTTFNTGDKIIFTTTVKCTFAPGVIIKDCKSNSQILRVVNFKKGFQLKYGETFNIVCIGTLPTTITSETSKISELIQFKYSPKEFEDYEYWHDVLLPEATITLPSVIINSSFPAELIESVPAFLILEIIAKKKAEISVTIRQEGLKSFSIEGNFEYFLVIEEGETRKIFYTIVPLRTGDWRIPQIKVTEKKHSWISEPYVYVRSAQ